MVTVGLELSLTNTGINSWQFSVTLEETLKEQNGHPLNNTLTVYPDSRGFRLGPELLLCQYSPLGWSLSSERPDHIARKPSILGRSVFHVYESSTAPDKISAGQCPQGHCGFHPGPSILDDGFSDH